MVPATLTLFEHQSIDYPWIDADLAAMEHLNAAFGAEILRAGISRQGRKTLHAGHHVGVVYLRNQVVQILPKIHRSHGPTAPIAEASRNLLYLLSYTEELPIREYNTVHLAERGSDWFELLTYLFASHLTAEWQRGPFKHYQQLDDNLPLLKGQWRIGEQLRRPDRRHHFAVRYDEFTVDNQLNQIFRFVVESLCKLTRNPDNQRRLAHLRQLMAGVSLLPTITVAAADQSLINRLNRRYAPLLNLARLFLAHSAVQWQHGRLESYAFVFDMNRLFEAFVTGFIQRHRHAILPPTLADAALHLQSGPTSHHLATTHSAGHTHQVFRLEPDLLLYHGAHTLLLLDVKYKVLDSRDRRLGISQADLYQMVAYAERYATQRVLLVYPQTADMDFPVYRHFALQHAPRTIAVCTLDICQDLSKPAAQQTLIEQLRALFTYPQEQPK